MSVLIRQCCLKEPAGSAACAFGGDIEIVAAGEDYRFNLAGDGGERVIFYPAIKEPAAGIFAEYNEPQAGQQHQPAIRVVNIGGRDADQISGMAQIKTACVFCHMVAGKCRYLVHAGIA